MYFLLRIESAIGFEGRVNIKHYSSAATDMILTSRSLCSGLANTLGFGDPCHCSRSFKGIEWRRIVQEGCGIGRTRKGFEGCFKSNL